MVRLVRGLLALVLILGVHATLLAQEQDEPTPAAGGPAVAPQAPPVGAASAADPDSGGQAAPELTTEDQPDDEPLATGQTQPAAGAKSEGPVQLWSRGPFPLKRDATKATAFVPVRILSPALDVNKITLNVIEVTYENISNWTLTQSCKVLLREQGEALPLRLEIELDFTDLEKNKWFGTYGVLIHVLVDGKSAGQFAIPLTRPETKLVTPSDVYLERCFWLWDTGNAAGTAPDTVDQRPETAKLCLRVQQGPSPADLSVVQVDNATIDGKAVAGNLLVDTKDFELTQLKPTRLPVSIEAPFPLGEATGKVTVFSPDMAPLDVNFKVATTRHKGMICMLALLGLLFGFGVRVGLQVFVESRAMWLQFYTLSKRIRQHDKKRGAGFEDTHDKLIKKTLANMKAVKWAFSQQAIKQLQGELTEIQNNLAEALRQFEGKRTQLEGEIAKAQAVTEDTWKLPPPMKIILEQSRAELDKVAALVAADDLTGAEEALGPATDQLSAGCDKVYRNWRAALLREIAIFPKIATLPHGVPAQVAALHEQVKTLLKIPSQQAATEVEQAHATVRTAVAARKDAGEMVRIVIHGVQQSVTRVRGVLGSGPDSSLNGAADALKALGESAARLDALSPIDEIDKLVPPYEGATALDGVESALHDVLDKLAEALRKQLPVNEQDKLESLLKEHKYEEAATKVVEILEKPVSDRADRKLAARATEPSPEGEHEEEPQKEPVKLEQLKPAAPPFVLGGVAMTKLFLFAERLETGVKHTIGQILFAQTVQFVLVAIGLAFVALVTFQSKWVGTLDDCVAVIFWAFALDVGVNTLLNQAKTPGTTASE
jgi:hypothetical protein